MKTFYETVKTGAYTRISPEGTQILTFKKGGGAYIYMSHTTLQGENII